MSRQRKTVSRRTAGKPAPLILVSLRIDRETWERAGWMAHAATKTRNAWVRDTIARASEGAKRPNDLKFRGIEASGDDWERWEQIKRGKGESLESLWRRWLDQVLERQNKAEAQ